MSLLIDTDQASSHFRNMAIDTAQRRLLITNLRGTEQERDLSEPANCNGFGRIRHFRRLTNPGWPDNPLPIDPALAVLGLPPSNQLRAQVFQNAVCNWRCWYCYVPFSLLAGSLRHAAWLSTSDLVELYLDQPDPPLVIDLSGGQPDLTPEWVPWMMAELKARELDQTVYLWSDDNLSNDYFWRHLSCTERNLVATYPMYGRVCCFKGFDAASFSFNTSAEPELFDRQFDLMRRLLNLGIDVYAYATFTAASSEGISEGMKRFVDRLQQLDENLPLRTIPLEIQTFSPVARRITPLRNDSLQVQRIAIEAWNQELWAQYSAEQRTGNISEVRLATRS